MAMYVLKDRFGPIRYLCSVPQVRFGPILRKKVYDLDLHCVVLSGVMRQPTIETCKWLPMEVFRNSKYYLKREWVGLIMNL